MQQGLTQFRLILRSVFRRKRVDLELDEELRYHLQREIDEALNRGLSPEEARRAALREMGAIAKNKDECRDMRRMNWIDDLLRDLRYAGRSLYRSPGFAALVILIMSLGIGANTAVFSVVNAVLLRPLAYRDPDRIVALSTPLTAGETLPGLSKVISIPNFQDWHDQTASFNAMAYYQNYEAPVMPGPAAEYAQVARVSAEFFRVFGVEPVIGRGFSAEEVSPGSSGAALISYSYFQGHFGGDPQALGRTVRVYSVPVRIVGVLPPGFQFPGKTELWYPADTIYREAVHAREARAYRVVGRLRSGISPKAAQIEMTYIGARLEKQYPDSNKNRTIAVTILRDELTGDARPMLYLLLGAVSVVLLIACANTVTLLLGKATSRTREVAVRVALGANRRRIIRQLITESLLLALLAGIAGLLIAYGGSKALVALAPVGLPHLSEAGIDAGVLAFTLVVSLATSLVFGIVPAIYASKIDLNDALKQGATRSVISGGMTRTRGAFVVAQIALSVLLLSGAGLLIKSFVGLQNVALGFRPENVLLMQATVPAPLPEASPFFRDVLPRIAALPGVSAAGATSVVPGHIGSIGPYYFNHLPVRPDPKDPNAAVSIVAPDTFLALGIPLKSGRDFTEEDTFDKPPVVIVNEALVRESLPDQNPIGKTFFCISSKPMTIIGVVGDVRDRGPSHEPIPECYLSYRQRTYNGNTLSLVVRTVGDPSAMQETLRRIAHEQSLDVPIRFTTLERETREAFTAPRFSMVLVASFAGLALCLAMAGVYGAMSYAVGQRSSEFGLRMALGASRSSVLRLTFRQALACAALGLALGVAAAVANASLLTNMLFQVRPTDPLVYLGVSVVLGAVTLVASYVPASRASRIDPLMALRQE